MRFWSGEDFRLTEAHREVQRAARKFTEQEILPIASELDHREELLPLEILEKMAELGYFGVIIPEEYGGAGLDCISYAIIVEELCRGWMCLGGYLGSHSIVCQMLYRFGTEEQKRKFLVPLAKGEKRACLSLTEPEHGSDAASIETQARREGDYYVINGRKQFTTGADRADYICVIARTDPKAEPKHRGIGAFLVERDREGVVLGEPERKVGYHGIGTYSPTFQDCRVPADHLIGEVEGQGFKQLMVGLEVGRINVACRALGLASAAFEASIKYAQERVQFGRPIAQFQAIQFKLADMATRIEAARLLTYKAAARIDRGERADLEAGMAKLYATEAADWITYQAIQIHGGVGYIKDFPLERYWRDSRLLTLGEGTSEIQRLIIARRLLEQFKI